jgi:hypothetical protein
MAHSGQAVEHLSDWVSRVVLERSFPSPEKACASRRHRGQASIELDCGERRRWERKVRGPPRAQTAAQRRTVTDRSFSAQVLPMD